jgi:hypothetical protein
MINSSEKIDKKRMVQSYKNLDSDWFNNLDIELQTYTLGMEYIANAPISDTEDCLANIAIKHAEKWKEWESHLVTQRMRNKELYNTQKMRRLKQDFAADFARNTIEIVLAQPEPYEIAAAQTFLSKVAA